VDVIDVEVPGQYVKALTSASSLVKEINFSKHVNDEKKRSKKLGPQTRKPESQMTPAEKTRLHEEEKKKEMLSTRAQENDISGLIYLKTEWKGEGPDMPPMRTENLFKSTQAVKWRKNYNEDE